MSIVLDSVRHHVSHIGIQDQPSNVREKSGHEEEETIPEALTAVSKGVGLWVMWGHQNGKNVKLDGGMKGFLDYDNGNKYGSGGKTQEEADIKTVKGN